MACVGLMFRIDVLFVRLENIREPMKAKNPADGSGRKLLFKSEKWSQTDQIRLWNRHLVQSDATSQQSLIIDSIRVQSVVYRADEPISCSLSHIIIIRLTNQQSGELQFDLLCPLGGSHDSLSHSSITIKRWLILTKVPFRTFIGSSNYLKIENSCWCFSQDYK